MANECHKELKVSFTQAFIGQPAYGYQPRKLPNTLPENAALNLRKMGLFYQIVGIIDEFALKYRGIIKSKEEGVFSHSLREGTNAVVL